MHETYRTAHFESQINTARGQILANLPAVGTEFTTSEIGGSLPDDIRNQALLRLIGESRLEALDDIDSPTRLRVLPLPRVGGFR